MPKTSELCCQRSCHGGVQDSCQLGQKIAVLDNHFVFAHRHILADTGPCQICFAVCGVFQQDVCNAFKITSGVLLITNISSFSQIVLAPAL